MSGAASSRCLLAGVPASGCGGSLQVLMTLGIDVACRASPVPAGTCTTTPSASSTDLPAVQRYVDGRDIEIIAGDITATCGRLEREDLVLTFIDADNYTPGRGGAEGAR
jgi:hypothetical protein